MTGGALQYPESSPRSVHGLTAIARREGRNTWKPVIPITLFLPNHKIFQMRKVNEHGMATFDPKDLKKALRELGKQVVRYRLTKNSFSPGKMRLPGWAQVWAEAEDSIEDTLKEDPLGRSLTVDTLSKSKETLKPYTEQVGKNKFLPSGLAF